MQSKLAVYLAAARTIVATDFADYETLLGPTGAGRLTTDSPASIAEGLVDVLSRPDLAARLAASTKAVARKEILRHGPQPQTATSPPTIARLARDVLTA